MIFGPFTIALLIITVLISIPAMNDERLVNKLMLWPRRMDRPSEYYRLLTSGFVHADWGHLFFNMFALAFFGSVVERQFAAINTPWLYILMYLSGIVAASLPSFMKNRHNAYYRALGASGGVAAVLFSSVYFAPWDTIRIYFIPMPSIVFAVLYLVYSAYMTKKGRDNVGHDAHFWGSVYGFLFTLAFDPTHGRIFFYNIMQPHFNF